MGIGGRRGGGGGRVGRDGRAQRRVSMCEVARRGGERGDQRRSHSNASQRRQLRVRRRGRRGRRRRRESRGVVRKRHGGGTVPFAGVVKQQADRRAVTQHAVCSTPEPARLGQTNRARMGRQERPSVRARSATSARLRVWGAQRRAAGLSGACSILAPLQPRRLISIEGRFVSMYIRPDTAICALCYRYACPMHVLAERPRLGSTPFTHHTKNLNMRHASPPTTPLAMPRLCRKRAASSSTATPLDGPEGSLG